MGQYNKKLRIIANVVLFIMTLLCILPLILLVVSSFTAEEVLVQNGYSFFPGVGRGGTRLPPPLCARVGLRAAVGCGVAELSVSRAPGMPGAKQGWKWVTETK